VENENDYPAQAVTEVHRAYQALVSHPLATAQHAKDQIDFLLYLGARREAGIANRYAVKRFSSDSNLHTYLINQAKWEGGMTALAATYETLQSQRRDPSTDYYAGYAMLLVAEEHVRTKSLPAAERAYKKSISNLERSWAANETYRDFASHYAALARGGLAKMALDAGQFDKAYVAILAAATGRPATFESPDGLGNTLQRTTRRLRRKLSAEKKTALDEKLKTLELSLESK
jgi:predicted negative regulator of RcsB-dependent stress response